MAKQVTRIFRHESVPGFLHMRTKHPSLFFLRERLVVHLLVTEQSCGFVCYLVYIEPVSLFGHSQIEGLHSMDEEFGADNLDMFFDWDDDDFLPTFLQSDTPITAMQDPNLMPNFNFQTEVAPVNPPAVRTKLLLFLYLTFL